MDFLVEIVDAPAIPVCTVNTAIPTNGITAIVGQKTVVDMTASIDGTPANGTVDIIAAQLPPGAVLTPSGKNTAPVNMRIEFTPQSTGATVAAIDVVLNGVTSTCSIPFTVSVGTTINPTANPSSNPTKHPSHGPTTSPSRNPTANPTLSPTSPYEGKCRYSRDKQS